MGYKDGPVKLLWVCTSQLVLEFEAVCRAASSHGEKKKFRLMTWGSETYYTIANSDIEVILSKLLTAFKYLKQLYS
jgi:hypothetical protein